MKTLTNLNATVTETPFQEPPVYHHNCGETFTIDLPPDSKLENQNPTPGRKGVYQRFMRSGPAGVILSNGKTSIVIPKDELWKLAEKHEPLLAVPKA